MNEAVLTVSNASIGYKQGKTAVHVVDGIEASLHSGELVVLVGCNGAGKSTLLRTLAAYIPPLTGGVSYQGDDIMTLTHKDVAKRISVVLTDNTSVGITVQELVSFGRMPYTNFVGHLKLNDKRVVEGAMRKMGIKHLSDRMVNTLSDGERQKCMIAKAFAQETPVMLLDEPTAFLDFGSKVMLLRMLKGLAREDGKAILISTHDIELAIRFADKMWILLDGGLEEGSVDELSENGVLQRFVGNAGIKYDKTEKRFEII